MGEGRLEGLRAGNIGREREWRSEGAVVTVVAPGARDTIFSLNWTDKKT